MDVRIIVAVAKNRVIGKDNQLPWRLSTDLKRFRELTAGHTVIMGRNTYESIGKPLPNRENIVVSSTLAPSDGIHVVKNLKVALEAAPKDRIAFVIGGVRLFSEALPICTTVHLTEVLAEVEGDVLFPEMDWSKWTRKLVFEGDADEKNQHPYRFIDYLK